MTGLGPAHPAGLGPSAGRRWEEGAGGATPRVQARLLPNAETQDVTAAESPFVG